MIERSLYVKFVKKHLIIENTWLSTKEFTRTNYFLVPNVMKPTNLTLTLQITRDCMPLHSLVLVKRKYLQGIGPSRSNFGQYRLDRC